MFNDSSMYNLSNPALNDDIGLNNLNRMLPMAPPTFVGGSYLPNINGSKVLGQLDNDIYQPTRKERDEKTFKRILVTTGTIIAAVLCFKGGKKIWNALKNLFHKTPQTPPQNSPQTQAP